MTFEKLEFKFPHEREEEQKEKPQAEEIQIEIESDTPKKPAAKEKDLEIEVVDDTPPKDRGRKPSEPPQDVTDEELGEYSDKVQKRIKHLSKGYHDERRKAEAALREREEAVRLAQQLLDENNKLKESVNKNQETLIEQAKIRAKVELEQAKQEYKRAYESGDADKVVAAQESLTSAKIKAERVAILKASPLQTKEIPVKTQNTDPEPLVDTKAVEWQKTNDWFGSDDEMTSFALGVHQRLVKEGVDTRSDDYYEKINSRMRQVFPDRFDDVEEVEEAKPAPRPRQQSTVVAPVTRSTAPRKIVLTERQVALARRLGLTPEQYGRQFAKEMGKQNG
jgi:hypothetical protein